MSAASPIRLRKEKVVAELTTLLGKAPMVVVAHYTAVDTQSLAGLRHKLRAQGGRFKVVKNRLARRALEGTPNACLAEFLSGHAAVAWSDDPVSAPKAIAEFRKEHETMVIVGGALDGEKIMPEEVSRLASMPSLDELHSKLAGLLMAPATKIATLLTRPGATLAMLAAARGKGEGDAA